MFRFCLCYLLFLVQRIPIRIELKLFELTVLVVEVPDVIESPGLVQNGGLKTVTVNVLQTAK